MKIKSKILPVPSSNIDTDQIIPARHLTGISKTGLGKFLFEDVPSNPLNNPEAKGSEIIVTLENFGCGSSREHAAWAILDQGFKAVIAISFARIFEDNCYNNGIVPAKLEEADVHDILKEVQNGKELEIDVINQKITYESGGSARTIDFQLDPLKKEFILHGGFMNFLDKKVPEIKEWAGTKGK